MVAVKDGPGFMPGHGHGHPFRHTTGHHVPYGCASDVVPEHPRTPGLLIGGFSKAAGFTGAL
jgi:hypothetical protein